MILEFPKKQKAMELIGYTEERIVGMTQWNDTILIATDFGVWILKDGVFVPVPFVDTL
jgi:hypothetical protein